MKKKSTVNSDDRFKLAKATAEKREATKKGEQYAKHGLHKGKKR